MKFWFIFIDASTCLHPDRNVCLDGSHSGVSLISSCWDDFCQWWFPSKEKAKPTLFSSTPPPKKILLSLKHYYPSPPPQKNFILCTCFFFKCFMYALMIGDTTSKVDQCKAHLFLVSATLLSGGVFYYKSTKYLFEMTRFMYTNYLNLWLRFPPVMMLKPPIQQRIQSTQPEGGKFHLWMHKTWLIERCFNPQPQILRFALECQTYQFSFLKTRHEKKQGCNL